MKTKTLTTIKKFKKVKLTTNQTKKMNENIKLLNKI